MNACRCAHCGEPATGPAPAYCCAGCRTLAGILPDAPAAESRYAHYDDPAFLDRFVHDGAIELEIDAMHCPSCVSVLERLPRTVLGVREARVDFGRRRLRLAWDGPLSSVADAVHALGYPSRPVGVSDPTSGRGELLRLGISFALAGNVMLLSAALYAGADGVFARAFEWAAFLLAVPVVTYGAWPFYRGAIAGLRARVPHMDLPVSLGLIGGFSASLVATFTGHGEVYYDSLAALVFLLLLGRRLQTAGHRAAVGRAELLWSLTPGGATRREDGEWRSVPATALRSGDLVRVAAGETLAVDGDVESGRGALDLRLLTGESRPVAVAPGAQVFAGTVNLGEPLEVRATASGAETRLGGIVEMAARADADRAPVVRIADRAAGWFVLGVLALAVVGGAYWWSHDPSRVFDVVVSLLVVSCPCALGLATPVALAVARGRAASAGLLFASTAAVERLARVDRVALDKTGTLTEGRMQVTQTWLDPAHRRLVGALEARSIHPLARALATDDDLPVSDVLETPGRGIRGRVAGHLVEIGAPGALGIPDADPRLHRGETPVAVRIDGEVVGLIALDDPLRPDAADAVADLRALGVGPEVLSGDHPSAATAVGARLGIPARGGVDPEGKAAHVRGGGVAMVGDGFNDAPALRAAEVGLAVRGGAEMALRVADVFLAREGVAAVADAIEGAQRALRVVHRNLAFSLAYNVIFASLALAGLISPLAAAVLMPISSLTVVGSSVAARSFRRPDGQVGV